MRSIAAVALLGASVGLPACVSLPNADPNQARCEVRPGRVDPSSIRRPSGRVVTKVIQLTDDGEMVNRCQLTDALMELNTRTPEPQIVLVYVHGWKHDAYPRDADLRSFTDLAERIARRDSSRTRARVVGIYVAWNGRRTDVPVLKELTFWGRKEAADRVSQSATVTKLLGAIDNVRRQRGNRHDLVVYAGHSFGARILFTAVSQLMIHQVQMAHPGHAGGRYDVVDGPGDIVILVNPAFEASLFTSIHALRRFEESFRSDQPPVLLSISAENDRATGVYFPIGQTIGFNVSNNRRRTLGHHGPYRTHRLRVKSAEQRNLPARPGRAWFDDYCANDACLERDSVTTQPYNPFIVATADKAIVDGHSGIWGPRFVNFLADFIHAIAARR